MVEKELTKHRNNIIQYIVAMDIDASHIAGDPSLKYKNGAFSIIVHI